MRSFYDCYVYYRICSRIYNRKKNKKEIMILSCNFGVKDYVGISITCEHVPNVTTKSLTLTKKQAEKLYRTGSVVITRNKVKTKVRFI